MTEINSKQYFKKVILFTLILLIIISSFNYYIDPVNLFKNKSVEAIMAENVFQGYNLQMTGNYDERLFNKSIVEKQKNKTDVIVLGSSRTMRIRSSFFQEKSFFNHSVSRAVIEDYIAVYEMYKNKGQEYYPDTIIIGIDPWVFNPSIEEKEWLSVQEYYNKFISQKGHNEVLLNVNRQDFYNLLKYKELVSALQLKYSVQAIYKGKAQDEGKFPFILSQDTIGSVSTKLKDGSTNYNVKYTNRSQEEVLKDAIAYPSQKPVALMEGFTYIDVKKTDLLELLIDDIIDNDIEIIIYLPPYHPQTYKIFSESEYFHMITYSEQIIKEMAKRKDIKVMGSWDPSKMGLDGLDFYDSMHPKEIGTIKSLNIEL